MQASRRSDSAASSARSSAAVEHRARGLRTAARRRPGDPVPEPHQLPRLGVPDADVPRNISFVGKAEYMDSWKTKFLFPAMGMIPIDRSRRSTRPGRARDRGGGAAARRAVRHLPRGHPQPRRAAVQGPHRRGPAGDGGRLPDLPGRHRRHRRDPAARRQGAQAVRARARSRSAARSGRERYASDGRRAPRAAVDDRRGDVRDPRAHRPGVRQRVRRQAAEADGESTTAAQPAHVARRERPAVEAPTRARPRSRRRSDCSEPATDPSGPEQAVRRLSGHDVPDHDLPPRRFAA